MAPDIVAVPPEMRSAPLDPTPVPDKVMASANPLTVLEISRAAPAVTLVVPIVVPSDVLFDATTIPAEMLVAPEYPLAAESVSVPFPLFVTVPDPVEIPPLTVVAPLPSKVRFLFVPVNPPDKVSVPKSAWISE
jgi:membrane-bound metal-dependent hydrolase YbcI (DUF457 family)